MAMGIVDVLEPVQVDKHDSRFLPAALGHGEDLLEAVEEEYADGKSGQAIVIGHHLQMDVFCHALGHIESGEKEQVVTCSQRPFKMPVLTVLVPKPRDKASSLAPSQLLDDRGQSPVIRMKYSNTDTSLKSTALYPNSLSQDGLSS